MFLNIIYNSPPKMKYLRVNVAKYIECICGNFQNFGERNQRSK